MRTTVSARHCEIADTLRDRAESVLERLAHYSDRAMEGTVVFDMEGQTSRAELRVHVTGGQILVAGGEADDHRTALDRAEDKLVRQLKRTADVPRDRRRAASEPA